MYKSWTNVDARFVSLGVLPQGRSIRACRNFCNRHGIDFPGKKEIDNIHQRIHRIEDEADKLKNPDGGSGTSPRHKSHNTAGKSAAGGKILKTTTQRKNQDMNQDKFREIAVSKIRENPNNPRSEIGSVEDLKASINANGLLQNITVRPLDDDTFEVIAGSRRYKACRELGMQKVPCTIIEADDATAYTLATTENIVRENMTAVDEANAVAKLFAQGKGRTEIGAMFGKSARWAEGRRRITELGDKAMKYLAEGRINLGHAEILTMCAPEDVNKYLEFATWKNPEELKRTIMDARPLLERAPFEAKKVCKNCEKRSDRQLDLFGDVQCSYCLDRECFERKVKDKAEQIRKDYIKKGFDEVPEAELREAMGGLGDYIDAETTDEDEKDRIEKLKEQNIDPFFWVDDTTAEHGLAYRVCIGDLDDDNDDETTAESTADLNSWSFIMDHFDYKRREKIRKEASAEEKRIVANKLKGVFGNISRTAKSFILEILERVYEDENGNQETYLKHQHDAEDDFLDEVADHIVNWYNGVDDDIREFLEMDSREEFERNANNAIGEEKPEDSEEDSANEEE
jgi:ParB family chromosome partitioning protein